MDKGAPKVAVIGAGVVGMTVADILQKRVKADVTILASKFHEDTVSRVAAGIFRPGTSFKGPSKPVTKKWIDDSWYYWQDILQSAEASEAGLMKLNAYIFSSIDYSITRNHYIEHLVPMYRKVDEDELNICGEGFKYGSCFSTVKIGCEKYLPWVEKRFLGSGGKIMTANIESLALLPQKYDMVFNCTGFGAKKLCEDHDLVPIRGQVVKVKAPWLKTAFYNDLDTYIIPGLDGVATLGGTRQYDSYNLDVCKYDMGAITERCYKMLPQLKKALIVETKVGLRPHRIPVRVEMELVSGVKVVHCYGHGGYGVTCAPGTANHAVNIGLDFLKSNVRNKL